MSSSARTHYDTLGITRDADADEIRRAWRLMVQAWHPDKFSGDTQVLAEEKASEINGAYHVLRDASRRAAYDCRLAADDAAAEAAAEPARRAKRAATGTSHASTVRAAERVGAPHVHAVSIEPETSAIDQLGREVMATIRRHPRIIAAVAAVWVMGIGGTVAWSAVTGPSLPAAPSSMSVSAAHRENPVPSEDDTEEFAALADRVREEADAADAELARQMRADEAAQAAIDRQIAAEAALAAKAARAAKAKPGAKRAATTPPVAPGAPAGRMVRVMPDGTVVPAS